MGTPVPVPYSPPGSGGGVDGGIDGSAPATNAGPRPDLRPRRHFVAVPNYYSGYVYIYGLAADGTVWLSRIVGLGRVQCPQCGLHYSTTISSWSRIWGSNLIEIYAFNGGTGALTPVGSTTLPAANSGPRHLALHANGKWLYSHQRNRRAEPHRPQG